MTEFENKKAKERDQTEKRCNEIIKEIETKAQKILGKTHLSYDVDFKKQDSRYTFGGYVAVQVSFGTYGRKTIRRISVKGDQEEKINEIVGMVVEYTKRQIINDKEREKSKKEYVTDIKKRLGHLGIESCGDSSGFTGELKNGIHVSGHDFELRLSIIDDNYDELSKKILEYASTLRLSKK